MIRTITEGLNHSNAKYYREKIQNFGMEDVSGEHVNIGGTNNYNITYVVQGEKPIAEPAPGTAPSPERDALAISPWWRKPEFIIGAIAIPIVAAVIGGLIQISPDILQRDTPTPPSAAIVGTPFSASATPDGETPVPTDQSVISDDDARATGAAQAYETLTAIAPTNTPPPTATPDRFTEIITLASNFSGTNTDWTPQVWTFADDPAGAEMVVVPVGSFEMGSPTNESGRNSDEAPHPQQVTTPYFIDRYEITNAQFAAFLNDSAEARDNRSNDGFEYIDTDDNDARIRLNGDTWEVIPGYENHPVTEVTWFGGRDFCAGRGMSLPTELQWEYAASGPSNWVYPWGDSWNENNAVWASNNPDDTNTDVIGSKPGGASWVGAEDMAGNVWEWVSTIYGVDQDFDYNFNEANERLYAYPYVSDDGREADNANRTDVRVLRGGGWRLYTYFLRSANRGYFTPDNSSYYLGFRCARSN